MQIAPTTAQRALLQQAAEQLGSPFYAYDLEGLSAHLTRLQGGSARLWYAVKANPLSAVIRTLADAGFGFDVASPGELEQVLAQGVCPSRILNTGPVKTPAMLRHFLLRGVRIFVLESHQQLADLACLCEELTIRVEVLFRVQLDWPRQEAGEINVLGGSDPTPFGLTPEQWDPDHLSLPHCMTLLGVHCFQWGNILDADTLIAHWQAALPRLARLLDRWQLDAPVVDLGGGLGIPYHGQHHTLAWARIVEALETLRQRYRLGQCWLELGRYAVGPYGYYLSPVADIKQNQGVRFAVIQGGSQHALRPALTGQAFPVTTLLPSPVAAGPYQIRGALCTGLDNLGDVELPEDLAAGQWLCFGQAGAYGFTESMPYFLCHTLPAEITLTGGQYQVLRRPQAAQHYLA